MGCVGEVFNDGIPALEGSDPARRDDAVSDKKHLINVLAACNDPLHKRGIKAGSSCM